MADNKTNKEIELLKEQLRLLEQLSKSYSGVVKDKTDGAKIDSIINKQMEIRADLEATGLKNLTNQYAIEKAIKDIRGQLGSDLKDEADTQQTIYETEQKRVQANKDMNDSVKERHKTEREEYEENERIIAQELKRIYSNTKLQNLQEDLVEAQKDVIAGQMEASREEKKRALETDKRINKIKEEIKLEERRISISKSKDKIKIPGLDITIGDLRELSKTDFKSQFINTLTDTLNSAVSTFMNLFVQGAKNQLSVYENTFENVSVRTGVSRGQYQQRQIGLTGELASRGLLNNVASSEVMDMWNSIAKLGYDQETMFERGIENVVTQHIVPYLDTTSSSVNLLNERLNGNFIKDIRGISKANLDIAGNNIYTQDTLNELIELVQPISDEALQNLAGASTEFTSFVNSLAEDLSPKTISDMKTFTYTAADDISKLLTSNNTIYRTAALKIMEAGLDVTDPSNYNDIAAIYLETLKEFGGMTPGFSGTEGALETGIVASAFGTTASTLRDIEDLSISDIRSRKAKSDLSTGYVSEMAQEAYNEFSGDENQTQKQLQDKTLENMSNYYAVWEERLGNWFGIVTGVLSSGFSLVLASIVKNGSITSGISKLIGGTGSTGGIGTLGTGIKALGTGVGGAGIKTAEVSAGAEAGAGASSGGTILGALGSVVAVVASTAAAMAGLTSFMKATNEKAESSSAKVVESELKGTGFENDSSMKYAMTQSYTYGTDKTSVGQKVTNWLGNAGQGVWLGLSKVFNSGDFVGNNKKYWDTIRVSGNFASEDMDNLTYAYAYLLNEINSLDSLDGQITEEGLKNYLKTSSPDEIAYTKSLVDTMIKENKYVPSGLGGVKPKSVNWDKYMHREGLDRVPYDDYFAILHENEAVLTASSTNALSNMLDEYKSIKEYNIQVEQAIRDQTGILVERLNAIYTKISEGFDPLKSTDIMPGRLEQNVRSMALPFQ